MRHTRSTHTELTGNGHRFHLTQFLGLEPVNLPMRISWHQQVFSVGVEWVQGSMGEELNRERGAPLLGKGFMPANEWHGSEVCFRLQSGKAERLSGHQALSALHGFTP